MPLNKQEIKTIYIMTSIMASQAQTHHESSSKPQDELILCPHCLRTASNGIKCQGICVADSGY
jgi:hypothetical protein